MNALADAPGAILDGGFDSVDRVGGEHVEELVVPSEAVQFVHEIPEEGSGKVRLPGVEDEVHVFHDDERRLQRARDIADGADMSEGRAGNHDGGDPGEAAGEVLGRVRLARPWRSVEKEPALPGH